MACTKCDLCQKCACKCECFDVDGESIEDLVLPKTYKLTITDQKENWSVKYKANIDILQLMFILEEIFGIQSEFLTETEELGEVQEFVDDEEE